MRYYASKSKNFDELEPKVRAVTRRFFELAGDYGLGLKKAGILIGYSERHMQRVVNGQRRPGKRMVEMMRWAIEEIFEEEAPE